ncbi:hypothetical protein [Bacillus sp. PS06]|uniref:hypothetical protein n=1 Tax=Bacillus sp. PS06 TaxID=2764176 RepID=UPI00177DC2BF|nr:hypothetical protein [Bacillus sp. PS06]MBD8069114.1 hypothetical protein [Bacillus sp. PS06]
MKNSHEEKPYLSYTLKTLDQKIEWNLDSKKRVGKNIFNEINKDEWKLKVKAQFNRWTPSVITVVLLLIGLFSIHTFLESEDQFSIDKQGVQPVSRGEVNEFIEGIHYTIEDIKGKQQIVLTEEGHKHTVYPLDAYKKIETINGEPELNVVMDKAGDKVNFSISAHYSTTTVGRYISVHTQRHHQSVDERVKMALAHPEYPAQAYTTEEIEIAGQRAVLQESVDGTVRFSGLQVITDKNIYYFYSQSVATDDFNAAELIELAKLFTYENEDRYTSK